MPEEYQTVMRAVEKSEEWALLAVLQGCVGRAHYVNALANVFQIACAGRDDKTALRYFGWVMQAIEDDALWSHIKREKGKETLEWHPSIPKRREAARRIRAAKTLELWSELPDSQRGTRLVQHAMDDVRSEPVDAATLLTTKEAMLTEVANRWRSTMDEEEGDSLFRFLCSQVGACWCDEYKRILMGVFRKATNESFPVIRLTRTLMSDSAHLLGEIMTTLAIARARNCKNVDVEISVLHPLEGCTDEAYRVTALFAAEIAALDRKAVELRKVVQPDAEWRGKEGTIFGEVTLTYLHVSSLAVKIVQKFNWPHLSQEPWGHNQFELARSRVATWKEANPGIDIYLSLTLQQTFNDKIIFAREQKL